MWRRWAVAYRLTALGLLRNRLALALIVLLPVVFYLLIEITTGDTPTVFLLPIVSPDTVVTVSRKEEALVFMGLAAMGFLSAFLGLYLVRGQGEVSRRLIVCGYRSSTLVLVRVAVLACAVAVVSLLAGALLRSFFAPRHLGWVVVGFGLVGYVYGCLGLLTGSLCKRELEGILSIVLVTNIDVGWLQNPIFYTASEHRGIIHVLPAFFPAQVAMTAAFADFAIWRGIVGSIAYGSVLLTVSMAWFWSRMRVRVSPERR